MRKLLTFLGGITLFAIVAAVIGIVVMSRSTNTLTAEGKAYVEASVQQIAANWDKKELIDRASPELFQNGGPDQLTLMFATLSKLGPMKSLDSVDGTSLMTVNVGQEKRVSAQYVAKAHFDNGEATFRIGLIKKDGQWRIGGFHVDPVLGANPKQQI